MRFVNFRKRLDFFLEKKGNILTVSGISMLPTIRPGWKVKISPPGKEKIKRDDIIVFLSKRKEIVCHRLVLKIGCLLFHKGDMGKFPVPILRYYILGRVVEVYDDKGNTVSINLSQ